MTSAVATGPEGLPSSRAIRALPLLLALVVAFAFQGSRGLFETTEGRYAECAREMIASGDFLEPTISGEPHWTKPPLTYWMIAGGVSILGRNAWGARLGNALAFVVTVLLVAGIGRRLWDRRAGWLAGVVYATAAFPVAAEFTLSTDTLLTLFEVGAVYAFVRAIGAPRGRWVTVMWLSFGLGFLTKGPPGLLPLIAILIWNRRRPDRVRLLDVPGLALFAVVGLGWYVYEVLRNDGLLSYFVGAEVVDRMFSNRFRRSPEWYQAFIRYLPTLLFGGLVWSCYLPGLVRHARIATPVALWRRVRGADAGALLLLWLAIPLAVFFVAQSRMYLYVLPLYAPIALGTARYLTSTRAGIPRRWVWLGLASAALVVSGKGVFALLETGRDMGTLYESCQEVNAEAAVYIVDESRLHGFEFYLDGDLHRLSFERERWADTTVKRFIDEVAEGSRTGPFIVVVNERYGDDVFAQAQSAGLVPERHSCAKWSLLEFRGPS